MSLLKETLNEFSQRTNLNCYAKIFIYNNWFVKFIWLFVLLGSASLTAWVLSWSVSAYLNYAVVSQIKVLYEMPAEFPAITICDFYLQIEVF